MSHISEITVSRSVRLNTGNYEGTEHFVCMKAVLDELDDLHYVRKELQLVVDHAMIRQLLKAYTKMGKKMTTETISKKHGLV